MSRIVCATVLLTALLAGGCASRNGPAACCDRAGCTPSPTASCPGAVAPCPKTAGGTPCCAADARVLRHVVLFSFKDSATAEDIRRVEEAFRSLPAKIPQIAGFEWGTDVSPEKRSEGFTHCFLLTFRSEADRDAYLPHPDHKAFARTLGPHLRKVLVVDYWAGR